MLIGITGSRGFIGSYLLRHITSRQLGPVRVLLRNVAFLSENSEIDVVHGDLLSVADCERFARDLEVILHLAHNNTPLTSDLDQPKDALLNIVPLLNLIQAVKARGCRPHVIYFSSGGAVYGRSPNRTPFRETDPCAPLCSYGIQKLAAEHYLRLAAEMGTLTCTVLRVGNAYGTLLPHLRMQGLIGVAVNKFLGGQPLRVFGSLANVRDYVHLSDICDMVEKAMRPTAKYVVVNVGSGVGHSVDEVLETIQECGSHRVPIEVAPETEAGRALIDWVVLDISRAKTEFGWTPRVRLRDGIARMVEDRRRAAVAG